MASRGEYWHPDYMHPITKDELAAADRETQIEVMRTWFLSNFENPVENTPYESREGGYIYIWGGPYDAEEELSGQFWDVVSEEAIQKLVAELEEESIEWSGQPSAEDFDDYIFGVIASNTHFHETFQESIHNIKTLLDHEFDVDLRRIYYMMLYVNIITAMETYLSDAFINTVLNDQDLTRRFVETNPDCARQKLPLSDIFSRMERLETEVGDYLLDLTWHNLERVKPMYKHTLGVDFPPDLKDLFKAILVRHDIVHRNGRTKDGTEIEVNRQDISELLDKVCSFVNHIDEQLATEEI